MLFGIRIVKPFSLEPSAVKRIELLLISSRKVISPLVTDAVNHSVSSKNKHLLWFFALFYIALIAQQSPNSFSCPISKKVCQNFSIV